MKLLLREGAYIYFEDNEGNCPIDTARETGNEDLIKIFEGFFFERQLADSISCLDREALDWKLLEACQNSNYDLALELLTQGADVNAVDYDLYSPLQWAAFNGDNKMVELLLEHGADPLQEDANGETPYDSAAPETISLLESTSSPAI